MLNKIGKLRYKKVGNRYYVLGKHCKMIRVLPTAFYLLHSFICVSGVKTEKELRFLFYS